jgi:hypothetical protein
MFILGGLLLLLGSCDIIQAIVTPAELSLQRAQQMQSMPQGFNLTPMEFKTLIIVIAAIFMAVGATFVTLAIGVRRGGKISTIITLVGTLTLRAGSDHPDSADRQPADACCAGADLPLDDSRCPIARSGYLVNRRSTSPAQTCLRPAAISITILAVPTKHAGVCGKPHATTGNGIHHAGNFNEVGRTTKCDWGNRTFFRPKVILNDTLSWQFADAKAFGRSSLRSPR